MTIQTSLKTGWVIRAVVMIVLGYGFAVWGYYDATIAYPKRGETYARVMEESWLKALGPDVSRAPMLVADPQAALEGLRTRFRNKERMSEPEQLQFEWLKALNVLGKLDEAPMRVAEPVARRAELEQLNQQLTGQPKPLNSYDIPSQWVIVAVGLLVGTWSLVGFIRASRHKFVYDTESGSLTIDGETIPADRMTDVDKRRWQKKSIAYLVTTDGERLKLDDWIYARTEDIVDHIEKRLGKVDATEAETAEPEPADETADAGSTSDATDADRDTSQPRD